MNKLNKESGVADRSSTEGAARNANMSHGAAPAAEHDHRRVGDVNSKAAKKHARHMNDSEFATSLKNWKLSKRRYVDYVSSVYPVVVGFNRALIRSIAKVDHVRQSAFVRSLAEQLIEEQNHNQLFRVMLTAHGVDHDRLYHVFESYMGSFTPAELGRMTAAVHARLSENPHDTSPGIFPSAPFPEPVLALCHRLMMTATEDRFHYWEHFAAQSGIEAMIYDFVSTSIYPGVVGNPELDSGAEAFQWGAEHAAQGSTQPGQRTDEEKHLELARIALNRDEQVMALRDRILGTADEAMRLFAATMICHNSDKSGFDVTPYLCQPKTASTPTV